MPHRDEKKSCSLETFTLCSNLVTSNRREVKWLIKKELRTKLTLLWLIINADLLSFFFQWCGASIEKFPFDFDRLTYCFFTANERKVPRKINHIVACIEKVFQPALNSMTSFFYIQTFKLNRFTLWDGKFCVFIFTSSFLLTRIEKAFSSFSEIIF